MFCILKKNCTLFYNTLNSFCAYKDACGWNKPKHLGNETKWFPIAFTLMTHEL